MLPEAIKQSEERLELAEVAAQELEAASSFKETEQAWREFLLASNSIYSKLEQGAKVDGKSAAWFGRKKHQRRKDPLLRYLHFARNADEHGLRRITEQSIPNTHLPDKYGRLVKLPYNEKIHLKTCKVDEDGNPEGAWMPSMLQGPHMKAVRVHDDRFRDYADPPKSHLGEDILWNQLPEELAKISLPFFRSLVEEARSLL